MVVVVVAVMVEVVAEVVVVVVAGNIWFRIRVRRAPPTVQRAAASGWAWRWWSILAVALHQAVATTALSLHSLSRIAPPPQISRLLQPEAGRWGCTFQGQSSCSKKPEKEQMHETVVADGRESFTERSGKSL